MSTQEDWENLAYYGWTIIANAYDGDWNSAPEEWREAARKWRTHYHSLIA